MIQDSLGVRSCVLSGANIANEVAEEKFCETTIGYRNRDDGELFRDIFHTPSFRVNIVEDVVGVELCGALKNIVAIGGGLVDGLKYVFLFFSFFMSKFRNKASLSIDHIPSFFVPLTLDSATTPRQPLSALDCTRCASSQRCFTRMSRMRPSSSPAVWLISSPPAPAAATARWPRLT